MTTSYARLLRQRDVRALLAATLLSRLGGRIFLLVIVLLALQRFGSPALAGWLAFASLAPGMLASPLAGALLDRIGAARAIALDMAVSAALVGLMIVADAGPALLMVLTAAFSLSSPLSAAGVRALLPRIVDPASLDRANALDTALHAAVDVAGPALAGALFGFGGGGVTLAVVVASFLAAALCVAGLHSGARGVAQGGLLAEAAAGLKIVLQRPTLRGLAVSYAVHQMTWGILVVVVPVAVTSAYGPGPAGEAAVGLFWAIVGVFGAAGALAAGAWATRGRERAVMGLGEAMTALAAFPLAASFGLTGLACGLALAGLMAGPIDVGVLTLRQRRTEPALLGRVMAVSMSLNTVGFPVGAALGGVLVEAGTQVALAAAATASALAACLVFAMIPGREDAYRKTS